MKSDRQHDEQRPPKTGELPHLHRRQEPKAPDQIDREQRRPGHARARKLRKEIAGGQNDGGEAEKDKQGPCDQTGGMRVRANRS